MKVNLIFCAMLLGLAYHSAGQTPTPYFNESRVIPPSPEAISLNQVGFSDVSLYTGKMNYSIPLYTIEQSGFSFPIGLSYVGGGGIKVEEVASSAGLGWSLNATGVVSRVIRGVADDTYSGTYVGWIHLPEIPNPSNDNYELFWNYARNKHDAQPDLYNVSVAGISAQFYIGKNKKVMLIDKSDIRIDPVFSGYELVAFKVKDLNGRTYYFETKEQSKSLVYSSAPEEFNDYATSSWYLSRIESEYGKTLLSFQYSTVFTKQVLRSPVQYKGQNDGPFIENNTTWSELNTYKCNLTKITFGLGDINFITSDTVRADLDGDKRMKQIVIRNFNADTIRQYQFFHSYFSTGSDNYRLKLDSLKELSAWKDLSQVYRFTYETSQSLPNRMTSFAMDHWGYYNGQSTNTGWEAKNRVKYYYQSTPVTAIDSILAEFGSANRAPDLTYAKAGVLTKVTTPTGGEVKFNYELHTAADSLLPNTMSGFNFFSTLNFLPNYFHVDLINEPFGYVRVLSDVLYNTYSFKYELLDSLQTKVFIQDTLRYGDAEHIYKLEKGVYFIRVSLLGSHPSPSYNHFTRVYVDQEVALQNKPVGGLRIRSMELSDPAFGTSVVRNYYYNEEGDAGSSRSTGVVSRPPTYGLQRVDLYESDWNPDMWTYYVVAPNGYFRTLSSSYPLGVTSGSHVGYGKVTTIDSNALKTESYFTTFKHFPESNDGFLAGQTEDKFEKVINGRTYQTTPFTPDDERDFLRGRLLRQITYEKNSNAFRKISETENTYVFNMGFKTKHGSSVTWYLPDTLQYLTGMTAMLIDVGGSGGDVNVPLKIKRYKLYTTSYAIKRTVTKSYFYQPSVDSLTSEMNYYYEDTPWYRDSLFHFLPTKTIATSNKGKQVIKNYYPYHWRFTIPGATSPELTTYRALDSLNRIGVPVLQVKEDSAAGTHLSTLKNSYSALAGSSLALNKISRKDGPAVSFRDLVYVNVYDTVGNILEKQKAEDLKTAYVWGHKNSYPIAEVVNSSIDKIFFDSFEDKTGWETYELTYDHTRAHAGQIAAKVTRTSGTPSVHHFSAWRPVSLSQSTKFRYSGWVYSDGPSAAIYFLMKTATETGYTTDFHSVTTTQTGKWVLLEGEMDVPANMTLLNIRIQNNGGGTVWFDDIRLHPAAAQMTVYTYNPLIGITSTADANNRFTYYEYDGFGRLVLVRDHDRRVLKKYCYTTAGQTENCNLYYNVARSGTFTRNNCGSGYTGGTATYSVPANIYVASSQAAADALAQADVNANGQAYANINATCTVVCDNTTCSGNNKKCVNGVCETGVRVNTDSYYNGTKWVCTYHYEWSDGSWSTNYTELGNFACAY